MHNYRLASQSKFAAYNVPLVQKSRYFVSFAPSELEIHLDRKDIRLWQSGCNRTIQRVEECGSDLSFSLTLSLSFYNVYRYKVWM